jgi:hypothetical protein
MKEIIAMLKRKKLLIMTVVALALMVAMATTALADAHGAYLNPGDSGPVLSATIVSQISHARGYCYSDSDVSCWLNHVRNGEILEPGTYYVTPGTEKNTVTRSSGTWYNWKVRLYPAYGEPNCHADGAVYDW